MPTTAIVGELVRLYHGLAELAGTKGAVLLRGTPPVILVQTRGRKKGTLGWHARSYWHYDVEGMESLHEITLSAETMNRDYMDIIETLLHEMVHHYNCLLGIRDCSASQYHNKAFLIAAERMGLEVRQTVGRGWNSTSLGVRARKVIEELQPKKEVFGLYRQEYTAPKQAMRMKLWDCGCTKIRCATEVRAACGWCGQPFERKGEG